MKPIALFSAVFSVIAAASLTASAQSYSIDWYTIDGGGGTSSGGQYTLSGTIGQPDAGTSSGGSYTLEGGFWSGIYAVQLPGSPILTITLSGPNAIVSWPESGTAGFVLQESTTLNPGSWANSGSTVTTAGGIKSVTVPNIGLKYFRLKN